MAVSQIISNQTRKIYEHLIPQVNASLVDHKTVAASNASQEEKNVADYVCNGTDDQVEIQEAIDKVNSIGGGVVNLTNGIFYCNTQSGEDFALFLDDRVMLRGAGMVDSEIRKTDGVGNHVIETPSGVKGSGIRTLTINGVSYSNTNGSCLITQQAEDCVFSGFEVKNGTRGLNITTPFNCVFDTLTAVACSVPVVVYNNASAQNFPVIRNLRINPNETIGAQFTMPSSKGIIMNGDNWRFERVDIRVCGGGGSVIEFNANNCTVDGLRMDQVIEAFEFKSGTRDNIIENAVIRRNYQSYVGNTDGTDQIVRNLRVVDAGWDANNFSLPRPDSEAVSPFPTTGTGHLFENVRFYEDTFTYVFDTIRVGVWDVTGGDDMGWKGIKMDGNRRGNLLQHQRIVYGINLENTDGCNMEDILTERVNLMGLRIKNCQLTEYKDFIMHDIQYGIYSRQGAKLLTITDGRTDRMSNTAADIENGNGIELFDIEAYDTGEASSGDEDSVFYLKSNDVKMDNITIEQDQYGFTNSDNNGINLAGGGDYKLSKCYITGDNGSLTRDPNGSGMFALGRGIFVETNSNVNEVQIIDSEVERCILAGIQIGTTNTIVDVFQNTMKTNSNTDGSAVGFQVANPNIGSNQTNGIAQLRVFENQSFGNNNNFKKYGQYAGDVEFKSNRGIKNDDAEHQAVLRHHANAYYSFDGSQFLTDRLNVHDASQAGGGSIVQGSSNGIIGDSAVFNGTVGDYINPPAEAFNFGTSPFTWQVWFYVSNMTNDEISLVEARGNSFQDAIGIELIGGTQKLAVFTVKNGGTPSSIIPASVSIQQGQWYHVVLKRDINDSYFLYIDGRLEAEDIDGTTLGTTLTGGDSAINPPTFSGSLDGRIDEVGCWFRDLHGNEITHLYNEGNGSQALLQHDWHSRPAQSDLHMRRNRITFLGEPKTRTDATTKGYVESLAGVPPLKNDLRAYYAFDGDYEDSTTNHYDGTSVGGIAFTNNGKINKAIEFDGNDSAVDFPSDTFDVGGTDFSISFWAYVKHNTEDQHIVTAQADPTNRLVIFQDESSDTFTVYSEESGIGLSFDSSVSLSSDTWHHLIIVVNGTTATIYINGQQDKSGTIKNQATMTGNLARIGGDFSNNTGNPLSGYRVDEFGIWNRVLTPDEIEHLYNGGSGTQYLQTFDWYSVRHNQNIDMDSNRVLNLPTPLYQHEPTPKNYVESLAGIPPLKNDLRAYYTFDGDYKDSTNNHYDGIPNGTTLNTNTSVIGSALEFTSDSDYVDIGKALAFDDEDFTISAWVYPRQANNSRRSFIATDKKVSSGAFFVGYGESSNNNFRFWTEDTNGSSSKIVTDPNYPTNQWYHVVVIKNSGTGEFWINGQKAKSGSLPSGNVAPVGNLYSFGGTPGSSTTLDGIIDEVGTWNRILTPDEIQHLYNHGNGTQYLQTLDWYAVRQSNHINMDNHRITNLGEAFYGSDAVDKAYVDSRAPMSKLYQAGRAYYEFNGNYGDSIGNFYGTPTTFNINSTNSMFDKSHEFPSGSDNVNIVETFSFGSSDFAISVWVYPKVVNNNRRIILESGKGGTNDARFILMFGENDVSKFTFYSTDTNGNTNTITSSRNFLTNRWHHVVLTRSAGTLQMWINGGKDVEGSISSGNIAPSGQDDFFGDGNSGSLSLDGLIDEVGVWDRILSESEIKYLYHNGEGTKNFVNYEYTFNYDIELNNNSIKNAQDITAEELYLTALPMMDPMVSNQVWNDNGTLKISSGF